MKVLGIVVTLFAVSVLCMTTGMNIADHLTDVGREAGHSAGFKEGVSLLTHGWLTSVAHFDALRKKYGSIHDTPWNEFAIQEKMFLCAYGSPGNKLSDEDINRVIEFWGGGDK